MFRQVPNQYFVFFIVFPNVHYTYLRRNNGGRQRTHNQRVRQHATRQDQGHVAVQEQSADHEPAAEVGCSEGGHGQGQPRLPVTASRGTSIYGLTQTHLSLIHI